MASNMLLFFFFIFFFLILKNTEAQVEGVFIFGDSEVDVGNNNYLPFSIAKADFPYNGIDFPSKKPTGRFSNGKNAADFLAEKLGLPSSPSYLSMLFRKNKTSFLSGVNFASGASGVLNSTGQSLGIVIPLTKQVDYYENVYRDLVQNLGSYGAKKHLSKALFVPVTGSNDLLNYFASSDLRKKHTPQQYVDSMILTLKAQIKRMHGYGGRKYLFPGLGTVGCAPSQRIKTKAEECNEELNALTAKYNQELKLMLEELKSQELQDFNYSYFDTYSLFLNIIQKPAAYGFTETKAACCGLGKLKAEVPCIPISTFCSNRNNHVFWDMIHPTEATARLIVNTIVDDQSQHSLPISFRQLIAD